MASSELCRNIMNRMCWDKILISPAPRSGAIHEGYRINIDKEDEATIQRAKKILQDQGIVFDDRKATSFSESVQPGDRTLRVIHQKSVVNLRKMWEAEFKKSILNQTVKSENERS